jgi:predicted phage gp36 major capsid-like protein
MTDFEMQPEFMSALNSGFQGASAGIQSAYSAMTPTVVSSFCVPIGALGVGNIIPTICETSSTNFLSGTLNATTHGFLGVATTTSAATFTAADTAAGPVLNA